MAVNVTCNSVQHFFLKFGEAAASGLNLEISPKIYSNLCLNIELNQFNGSD